MAYVLQMNDCLIYLLPYLATLSVVQTIQRQINNTELEKHERKQ
jgi:hypothetical protein